MITTKIRETDKGHQVCFTIAHQSFCLQERLVYQGDSMGSLEYAKWYEKQFLTAFRGVSKKRNFHFDYISKAYFDGEQMMGETDTKIIEAWDEEHAKLLFEKEFPGTPYDTPY